MRAWIVGKSGMLSQALQKRCEGVCTSREEVDIRDQASVMNFKPDVTHVINCAGYTDVEGAELEPEEAYALNVLGPRHLAQACKMNGWKMVHISTDFVFDGKKLFPYHETDKIFPLSMYGKTKWLGEKRVLGICPDALILRTSWLYGDGKDSFVSKIMKKSGDITVVDDEIGSPTWVEDLAEAIVYLKEAQGIVHFSCVGEASRLEWAQEIARLTKMKSLVTKGSFPSKVTRPSYSVLDCGKYQTLTKKEPRHWKVALEEYLCS